MSKEKIKTLRIDFKIQKFTRQHPCKNCPFRKDVLKGWLGKERAEEMANVLQIDINLQGRNLVFDTKEEFIKHHTRQ